ncbi:hypothetical protein FACS1894202_10100 [Clostridia bacterium]|nr:hypothetical protein FACS1894202_10100 [Clostridia bacterium]
MLSFFDSVKCAWRGLGAAIKRERHMRFHLFAAVCVIAGGLIFRVSAVSWALLILACALVLVAELVNTALERLCDCVNADKDPFIRDCKDIAAGGVLVAAIASVVILICVIVGEII